MAEQEKAPEPNPNLLQALAESDEQRRAGRAGRILWVSALCPQIGAIVGPLDTITLLNEARECFIDGHYVATVLLATAFIEHTLTDELSGHGLAKPGVQLSDALRIASKNRLFSDELISRTDELRLIRNPFTHRKPSTYLKSFGNRFLARREHPAKILEEDAEQALALMYDYFRLALKELGE